MQDSYSKAVVRQKQRRYLQDGARDHIAGHLGLQSALSTSLERQSAYYTCNVGALIITLITYTILGVPYFTYSIMGPTPSSNY